MFFVYCEKCLPLKAVHNRVDKLFQESKVLGEHQPGRPVEIAMEPTMQQVEEMIRDDRRLTIHNTASSIGCSHSLAYRMLMHDSLNF